MRDTWPHRTNVHLTLTGIQREVSPQRKSSMNLMKAGLRRKPWHLSGWPKILAFVFLYFANAAAWVWEAVIQAHILLCPDIRSSSVTARLTGTWLESCGGTVTSTVGGVLSYKPFPQHLLLLTSHRLSEQRTGARLAALWQYPGNGNSTPQE